MKIEKMKLIDKVLRHIGLVRYSLYEQCRDGLSAASCFLSEEDEQTASGRFAEEQLAIATRLCDLR